MKLLVTGATGFVGSAVCALFRSQGWQVAGAARSGADFAKSLDAKTDWSDALAGVEIVVHLAARVHVMRDQSADPLAEFRRINVEGTRALAEQAAAAGVKRFVFLSSIKVNGEETQPGRPFTAQDAAAPQDPYGRSKAEAEAALHRISAQTGMELVILRPPLVYGPGVKGNFASLIKICRKGLPLPLGAIDNRRSLIALDNLAEAIRLAAIKPQAAGNIFLLRDGEDLSTADLIRRLCAAMGRKPRLLPVPPALLRLGAGLLRRKAAAQRLLGSLQIDDSDARNLLGYRPVVTVEEALRRVA